MAQKMIFTGGTIITISGPDVEAIAVEDGRIVAAGSKAEVVATHGADAQTVDLAGKTLLPGFIEAHGHPLQAGLLLAPPAVDIRPFTIPTAEGVTKKIQETVAAA